MNTHPIPGWTLGDWQAAYQHGGLNPRHLLQLVDSFPERDPAWIQLALEEQLLRQLDQLDHLVASAGGNRARFPLFGVPFAVKDNIDVAGFDTTAACPEFSYRPAQDAQTVSLLRAQGAIVVGKTNLDQFATGLVGTRSPYGIVPNTFEPRYISGGSSSGSASVVARGLVPFALGTDTAGSGRVPAAFNNIVGWKPTRGGWSAAGVVPACKTLDCVSAFTLTVEDAQTIASFLEAFDPTDAYSRARPGLPAAQQGPARLAVPAVLDFAGDANAESAFQDTVAALKNAGISLEPISFAPFQQLARLLYEGPWLAERLTTVEPLLLTNPSALEPVIRAIIEPSRGYTAVQTFRMEYERASLARAISATLDGFDALLVPTTPTIFPIEQVLADPIRTNAKLGTYTNFTNLADLCALAVPGAFRKDGIPAGVTFLAPAWREETLAKLGATWEQSLRLPRGATRTAYAPSAPIVSPNTREAAPTFELAVVGAHLSGLALNPQLLALGATLVRATRTSPRYRMYVLPHSRPVKPGMVRDRAGGSLHLEVWRLSADAFARFVSAIPSPLGIGSIELEDGSWVKGFLCEPHAIEGAIEITHLGGFRNYLQNTSAVAN